MLGGRGGKQGSRAAIAPAARLLFALVLIVLPFACQSFLAFTPTSRLPARRGPLADALMRTKRGSRGGGSEGGRYKAVSSDDRENIEIPKAREGGGGVGVGGELDGGVKVRIEVRSGVEAERKSSGGATSPYGTFEPGRNRLQGGGLADAPARREFHASTSNSTLPFDNDTVQKQLRLFWEMATPYFKEEKAAKWLLGGVILLTLASSGVSVGFSYVGRNFWTALSSKNEVEFYSTMKQFFGALVVGVPVNVMYKFQRQKLALSWREWLSERIMELYYSNRTYYTLEASKEIDNPDQRIAEDIRAFTRDSLEFFITVLTSMIDLVAFSSILYSIYPQLFLAIIAYASIGTFITTTLGKRLVGLNFLQLQREAFFRYSLMRVRENSESIAFYGGEALEMKEIQRRLDSLLDNFREVIGTQRNLEFFTVSYRFLIQVIPGLVVAPLFFAGKIELGVVSQSYSAFNHILGDLSLIVNQFESLSAFSAGIDRLAEFLDKIQAANRRTAGLDPADGKKEGLSYLLSSQFIEETRSSQRRAALGAAASHSSALTVVGEEEAMSAGSQSPDDRGRLLAGGSASSSSSSLADGAASSPAKPRLQRTIRTTIASGAPLQLEHVTVFTPDRKRQLVQDLSLKLSPGQRLLIVGNSGTGKSSLLRVMAGLWNSGEGHITRPSTTEMFFLPQKPYCTLGSLREQLTYPQKPGIHEATATDAELLSILDAVNLGELPRRVGQGSAVLGLDAVLDWSGTLSLGEQQRLAFGRLLYNRPRLAILDEATSALDLDSERRMYSLLQAIPGISYVSVGHRPSLTDFHDSKLTLTTDGFKIDAITPATSEAEALKQLRAL